MPYETFDLHFENCEYTLKIPLLHNVDDSRYFICHPELRDSPPSGKCPKCMSVPEIET
jgi:hypothetical protein